MPGSEIQLAPSICSTPACTSASLVTTMTSPTASARAAAAIVSRAIARASRGRSVPASSRRVLAAWVVFTGMMTLQSMGSLRGRIGQALGYRGAELWQDIAAVQLEEIGLVVPRIVEDEMGETEIEVALDLGHVLVGIVRDDEPARGALDRQFLGEALHLEGIVHARLLLGAERERRPEAGVLERLLTVGAERDLHLEHAVDARAVAALGKPLLEGGDERVGVERGILAARRDPPVGHATREARGGGAGRADVDRHHGVRAVVDGRVADAIEGAVVTHPFAAPQFADQQDRLLHALEALGRIRPRLSQRDLVERLARADAENDALRIHRPERRELLRDDARVIAEGRREHRGAEQHARGRLTRGSEPRQGGGGVAALVHPRLQVIAEEHGVEAVLLRADGVVEQFARPELFARGLVSETDGH